MKENFDIKSWHIPRGALETVHTSKAETAAEKIGHYFFPEMDGQNRAKIIAPLEKAIQEGDDTMRNEIAKYAEIHRYAHLSEQQKEMLRRQIVAMAQAEEIYEETRRSNQIRYQLSEKSQKAYAEEQMRQQSQQASTVTRITKPINPVKAMNPWKLTAWGACIGLSTAGIFGLSSGDTTPINEQVAKNQEPIQQRLELCTQNQDVAKGVAEIVRGGRTATEVKKAEGC